MPQGASEETAPTTAATGQPPIAPVAAPVVEADEHEDGALPDCLATCLRLLQDADAMPTENSVQERARAGRMQFIHAHVLRLQNGDPAPVPDAGYIATDYAALRDSRREARIADMERTDEDVRFIMDENRRLKDQLSKKKK